MSELTDKQMNGFIVLVEWDGNKPPTSWYSFLARYGLNTGQGGAGDKSRTDHRQTPLVRRMEGNNSNPFGVAFQEGAIVVNSGDMARRLASNARYFGATSVSIGSVSLNPYSMTPEDEQALAHAMQVTSKRGPKSKTEEGRYAIFCAEEAITHLVEMRERPVCCPECGSSRITWHRSDAGKIVKTFDPQTDDLNTYWMATRFDESGIFEVPTKTKETGELPAVPDTTKFEQGVKNQIQQTMEFTRKNAEQIDGDGQNIIRAMDLAYCVQNVADDQRLTRRINALREFYAGGHSTAYPMAINHLEVDVVDIAALDSRFISKL